MPSPILPGGLSKNLSKLERGVKTRLSGFASGRWMYSIESLLRCPFLGLPAVRGRSKDSSKELETPQVAPAARGGV